MILICIIVWVDPDVISRLFGAGEPTLLAESNHALRIFSLSFIPFCYIYAIMIVYKLYAHHRMALFISFALSLTVIPVLWVVSKFAPGLLWYSYLIAYIIEIIVILLLHKKYNVKFELKN
jgi:Na+-driven multidrug efflux pump